MMRYTRRSLIVHPQPAGGTLRLSEERQPRSGALLAGGTRRRDTRGPRKRQAPDGHKSGGTQPTEISVINRRDYWLLLFQWSGEKK
jgi:hypothetical protein